MEVITLQKEEDIHIHTQHGKRGVLKEMPRVKGSQGALLMMSCEVDRQKAEAIAEYVSIGKGKGIGVYHVDGTIAQVKEHFSSFIDFRDIDVNVVIASKDQRPILRTFRDGTSDYGVDLKAIDTQGRTISVYRNPYCNKLFLLANRFTLSSQNIRSKIKQENLKAIQELDELCMPFFKQFAEGKLHSERLSSIIEEYAPRIGIINTDFIQKYKQKALRNRAKKLGKKRLFPKKEYTQKEVDTLFSHLYSQYLKGVYSLQTYEYFKDTFQNEVEGSKALLKNIEHPLSILERDLNKVLINEVFSELLEGKLIVDQYKGLVNNSFSEALFHEIDISLTRRNIHHEELRAEIRNTVFNKIVQDNKKQAALLHWEAIYEAHVPVYIEQLSEVYKEDKERAIKLFQEKISELRTDLGEENNRMYYYKVARLLTVFQEDFKEENTCKRLTDIVGGNAMDFIFLGNSPSKGALTSLVSNEPRLYTNSYIDKLKVDTKNLSRKCALGQLSDTAYEAQLHEQLSHYEFSVLSTNISGQGLMSQKEILCKQREAYVRLLIAHAKNDRKSIIKANMNSLRKELSELAEVLPIDSKAYATKVAEALLPFRNLLPNESLQDVGGWIACEHIFKDELPSSEALLAYTEEMYNTKSKIFNTPENKLEFSRNLGLLRRDEIGLVKFYEKVRDLTQPQHHDLLDVILPAEIGTLKPLDTAIAQLKEKYPVDSEAFAFEAAKALRFFGNELKTIDVENRIGTSAYQRIFGNVANPSKNALLKFLQGTKKSSEKLDDTLVNKQVYDSLVATFNNKQISYADFKLTVKAFLKRNDLSIEERNTYKNAYKSLLAKQGRVKKWSVRLFRATTNINVDATLDSLFKDARAQLYKGGSKELRSLNTPQIVSRERKAHSTDQSTSRSKNVQKFKNRP